jgi:hypothetical protein
MRFGRLPSHTINRSFRGIPAFFQSKDIADFDNPTIRRYIPDPSLGWGGFIRLTRFKGLGTLYMLYGSSAVPYHPLNIHTILTGYPPEIHIRV